MSRRVSLILACLISSSSAQATAPVPPRLGLSLRGLEGASEVVYHPYRWLTIRRGIAFIRAEPVDDIVRAGRSLAARPRAYALTGDVHPFGDAFRISLGLREDDNRRLLRSSSDRSAIGTARYAPLVTLGFAGIAAEKLSIGADIGLVGRSMNRPGDSLLISPADQLATSKEPVPRYRALIQLSAGYRF